jgi:hypothetical protein
LAAAGKKAPDAPKFRIEAIERVCSFLWKIVDFYISFGYSTQEACCACEFIA